MGRQKELQSRNYMLEKRIQSQQPSASSGGAGIASGAAVVDAARIAVLEEKVAKLSEELTAELRSKNDTMSQLIKTKLQSEAGDRSLLAKEDEVVAMKKRMSEVEEERGLLITRIKELQATIDLLRGETGNYRKKLIEAEDRIKLLLAENETLLQNLLAFKNKQAEAVNVQNMAQEAARRQLTPQGRVAMEADMKVSEAAVKAADPAGQNRWDMAIGKIALPTQPRRKISAHNGQISCVAFDHSSTVVVSSGTDALVKLWDARTGLLKCLFRDAQQSVMNVCVSPDNRFLVGASSDKNSYVWDMQEQHLVHTLTGHTNKVYASLFVDQRHILTGSHDRSLRLWDAETGYCSRTALCTSALNFATIGANGSGNVATAHLDGHVRIWSVPQCELVHDIGDLHSQQTTSVDFSPDGNYLLTNSKDGTMKLIDLRGLKVLREFSHAKYKNAVSWNRASFSPDGKYVLAGSTSGALCVWNADSGRLELASPEVAHAATPIACSSWNRSGSQLASGDNGGILCLWDGA